MGLPFHDVLAKVRETEPQKEQENVFHQCRNLDGAFVVRGTVPDGPVLLVDDMVDSRCTLTLATILLRKAGAGSVIPFALATTWGGD